MVSSSDLYYSLATWNVRNCTGNGNRKFGTRFIGNRNNCSIIQHYLRKKAFGLNLSQLHLQSYVNEKLNPLFVGFLLFKNLNFQL